MLLTWVGLSMTFGSYKSLLRLSLFLLLVVLDNIDRCLSARPLFLQCTVLVLGWSDALRGRHLVGGVCASCGHRWRLWFSNEAVLPAVGAVLTLHGRWGGLCVWGLVSRHPSHWVTATVSKLLGGMVKHFVNSVIWLEGCLLVTALINVKGGRQPTGILWESFLHLRIVRARIRWVEDRFGRSLVQVSRGAV